MKRTLYLFLLLFVVNATNISAQVNIGSLDNPHAGAVLDLSKAKGDNLGLLLPKVYLRDIADFQLPVDGTSTSGNAMGMMVFNTNAKTTNGNGTGIYVWDGSAWKSLTSFSFSNSSDKVTSFYLIPSDSVIMIRLGNALTFTLDQVFPKDAIKGVTWNITGGGNTIAIDGSTSTNCTIKANAIGGAELTVSSVDNNAVEKIRIIVVAANHTCSNNDGYNIEDGVFHGGEFAIHGTTFNLDDLIKLGFTPTTAELCVGHLGSDKKNHTDARKSCENKSTADIKWRLPNAAELINIGAQTWMTRASYWSGTVSSTATAYSWKPIFGHVTEARDSETHNVVCVNKLY
jgi:hypothetical protein